jgi:translation initiation factor IF-3
MEVRLIDADGTQLGIVFLSKAKELAECKNLDLIEIAPSARPPVCKIMDYNKYVYEQAKKVKEARKKQKVVTAKEIRISPNIDVHDLYVKTKRAREFLEAGNKVKLSMKFRGREVNRMSHADVLIKQVADSLEDISVVEKRSVFENKSIFVIFAPIENKKMMR